MIVEVIWRMNDEVLKELYSEEAYYNLPLVYEDGTIRVYKLRQWWYVVDDTCPECGHALYISKSVPLKLAVVAAETAILSQFEGPWADIVRQYVPDELQKYVMNAKVVKEIPDYKEDTILIKVYIPTNLARELWR